MGIIEEDLHRAHREGRGEMKYDVFQELEKVKKQIGIANFNLSERLKCIEVLKNFEELIQKL